MRRHVRANLESYALSQQREGKLYGWSIDEDQGRLLLFVRGGTPSTDFPQRLGETNVEVVELELAEEY